MAPRNRFLPLTTLPLLLLVLVACGGAVPGGPLTGACHAEHASSSALAAAGAYADGALMAAALPAIANPQPSKEPPSPNRRWSDAAGWFGGRLPQAGDDVTIEQGDVVLLDVSPPPLSGLTIAGALVFDRADIDLVVDHILLEGGLYVGSAGRPFTQNATITLAGGRAPDDGCLGSNYIAVVGGTLELYGDPAGVAWTRLAATAEAGAGSITVDDAGGWRVGDSVAIASTDFYSPEYHQAVSRDLQVEARTVTAVSGSTLTLDSPLAYQHYGRRQTFAAGTGLPTTVLESRAEVARLSRNVKVMGAVATTDPSSPDYQFGGQVMAMGEARVRLDSVELTRMGQAGLLLRYPVHFHLMGKAGEGSFIRNSSLHGLFNRCVTIHGTGGVLVENNAAVDTFGHCYFLEDGAETGNVLRGNLSLQTRKPTAADALLPTDVSYLGPAGFWVTNPANYVMANVAASSEGTGFWYALPEHPTGPSYALFGGADQWPRRTPLGSFSGNLAHSNYVDGLHVDGGPRAGSLASESTYYAPRTDPADRRSAPVQAVFEGYVAYKQRNAAAWFRGDNAVLRGALLVDNAVGVTFASRASGLEASVVVGESDNLGTPAPWEPTGSGGRSLPKPWQPDLAIRGFEFYDGPVLVADSRFEGYTRTPQREAGALSVLDYTSFSMSPLSAARGLSFGAGTNRVHFETRSMSDYDPDTRDSGEDGYRSAVFLDQDGSVTGTAGKYVVMPNPFLLGPDCERRTDWNAYVCGGRYVSLTYLDETTPARGFAPLTLASPAGTHVMFGSPEGGPSVPNRHYRSIVPFQREYRYEHSGLSPSTFSIDLGEARPGDRLVVSVPFRQAATPFVYRDWWLDPRGLVPPYSSAAALRTGPSSGYFVDSSNDRLYLLLIVREDHDYARLTVCRAAGC
ncbi:MAG TPA: G8 domain-containing protein [Trueperaceae bacterium]|nr:G8 domain-containing protein [Trueperaceae bacterium]